MNNKDPINPGCHNVTNLTDNTTSLEPLDIEPNFPVWVYFLLMSFLLCLSTVAFTMLIFTKVAKKEKLKNTIEKNKVQPIEISIINKNKIDEEEETKFKAENCIKQAEEERKEKIILYTIIFWVSFICYGALPGLQSYSTLPYGNNVFNLSVNLSN